MKVIILAAGYGSRMYPLAQDKPKSLLTISGETLLDRQLRIYSQCGISDITVVTGFQSKKIIELYSSKVSIRHNPHYEIVGNLFTLWVVRDLLVDDTIVNNSDLVFTEQPIRALLTNEDVYCLVVDKDKVPDAEALKIKVVDGNIIELSKILSMNDTFGEAIGIARIKKEGMELFKQAIFDLVKSDSNAFWSSSFQYIAEKKHNVNYVSITTPWIEVDTKEDYEEAIKMF